MRRLLAALVGLYVFAALIATNWPADPPKGMRGGLLHRTTFPLESIAAHAFGDSRVCRRPQSAFGPRRGGYFWSVASRRDFNRRTFAGISLAA